MVQPQPKAGRPNMLFSQSPLQIKQAHETKIPISIWPPEGCHQPYEIFRDPILCLTWDHVSSNF